MNFEQFTDINLTFIRNNKPVFTFAKVKVFVDIIYCTIIEENDRFNVEN